VPADQIGNFVLGFLASLVLVALCNLPFFGGRFR
jgi:hypothetical protein